MKNILVSVLIIFIFPIALIMTILGYEFKTEQESKEDIFDKYTNKDKCSLKNYNPNLNIPSDSGEEYIDYDRQDKYDDIEVFSSDTLYNSVSN